LSKKRPTNGGKPNGDLFSRVEAYYRRQFESSGGAETFDRWLSAARDDLREAAKWGAEAAFLLHVLVCTADRRTRRYATDIPAVQRLSGRQRAQLIGALNLIAKQGEPWLREVLRSGQIAKNFYTGALVLRNMLAGRAVSTPAWGTTVLRAPTARDEKNAVTACIVCLHEALRAPPKAIAAVVVLLEKFELLKEARATTHAKFVEQRLRRKQSLARDRLGPVGSLVFRLRATFESLKEFLDSPLNTGA
jgi:hypothetical protein